MLVRYGEGDDGPSHTSVIAGWEDVEALAQGAGYQHGIARLEIKRDFRFGASTVRLIVRKVRMHLMMIWPPWELELCRCLSITELDCSN